MSPRRASPIVLEYILLDLVDQKPRHGYEIFKELEKLEGIGLIWHLKQSQLYALLEKLEKQELLAGQILPGENRPDRKELRLTEPGKQQLEEWAGTPVESPREMRQVFLAKLNHVYRTDPGRKTRMLVDRQKSKKDQDAGGPAKVNLSALGNRAPIRDGKSPACQRFHLCCTGLPPAPGAGVPGLAGTTSGDPE